MKILYICQHYSTGGMPQYVLKQVQTFGNEHDITVIEVNNYGDEYTVQRKKLPKLIQLNGNQEDLLETIYKEQPDILHFHEVPESFITPKILGEIYNERRNYKIVVTSHSSLTRRKDFTYIPDRLVAVNKWQKELFEKELPETQVDVWEYPIENKIPTHEQKWEAKKKLGIASSGTSGCAPTDILNVGLFTPGKNQGELFDMARKRHDSCDECSFHYHFVGNQAENFRSYWEPLMKNKPSNCTIWGERDDVELFYQAADEMIFTSLQELWPIVIREALSYGLPIKMKKLHTYGEEYNNNKLITFID